MLACIGRLWRSVRFSYASVQTLRSDPVSADWIHSCVSRERNTEMHEAPESRLCYYRFIFRAVSRTDLIPQILRIGRYQSIPIPAQVFLLLLFYCYVYFFM